MHLKYDHNFLFLWIFLLFQIVVLVGYLKFSSTWSTSDSNEKEENRESAIKFLKNSNKYFLQKQTSDKYKAYYSSDVDNEIYLKTEDVNDFFTTVSDTVCFQLGTDTGYMKRNANLTGSIVKCECLPGYHGNDCSLPEVIWRAFIAYRQETVIHKRNSNARRIIHMFQINHPAEISLAAITIQELSSSVSLFVVAEANETEYGETKPFYFKSSLEKGLCKNLQHKILFVPIYKWNNRKKWSLQILEKAQKIIKNLKADDLFIELTSSEIPNTKALLFFKLYDGFSLPLQFRLKWNIYGYFYQHPNKTKTYTTGYTTQMLEDLIYRTHSFDSIDKHSGLIVGDLNHYGGWFCDLCYDAQEILHVIQTSSSYEYILPQSTKVIDQKFIESIMENGIYVDGKTTLIRNHEWSDNYYAPEFVSKHYWKYDSLMINLYNKVDYN